MQLKLVLFTLAAVAVALTSATPIPTPGEGSNWPSTPPPPPPSTAVGNRNICSSVNGQGNKIKCKYEVSEDSDTDGLLEAMNSLLGSLFGGANAGNSRRSQGPGAPPAPLAIVGNGNTCSSVNGQGNKIKCEYEVSEDSDVDGLLDTVNSLLGSLLGGGEGNTGKTCRGQGHGPGAPSIVVGNGNTCSSVNGQGNKIKCEYEVSDDSDVDGLLGTVNSLLGSLLGGGTGPTGSSLGCHSQGPASGAPPTIITGNGNICSIVNGQGNKIECTVEVSQDSDSNDESLLGAVNNLLSSILGGL